MLDELLEKKLKDLKEKEILVVMDDGLAFLGTLTECDKNTLVLKNVYQAPAKKINWKKIEEESEETEKKRKIGFIDWTLVNLEEVYVRVDHIVRIWRWPSEEKDTQEQETKIDRKAVYSKKSDLSEERVGGMGDIPETFSGER